MTRMSAGDRRAALVDAAIRVMTREGVARATTRAIAAEADMPLGVLHYAFRSKQELMSQVTETIARRSKADIDAAVLAGGLPDNLLDLVHDGLCAYFEHVVAEPLEHLVTYEVTVTALRDEELREAAARQYAYYQAQNEELLAAAAELLGVEYVEPLPVVARYVFSMMDGLALNYLARGDADEARAVVDVVARSLVSLVRPR